MTLPKKKLNEKKETILATRVNQQELFQIMRIAAAHKISVSELLRRGALSLKVKVS